MIIKFIPNIQSSRLYPSCLSLPLPQEERPQTAGERQGRGQQNTEEDWSAALASQLSIIILLRVSHSLEQAFLLMTIVLAPSRCEHPLLTIEEIPNRFQYTLLLTMEVAHNRVQHLNMIKCALSL